MRLNYKRTIFVGFAFFLICMFWQAYDNTVPMMLVHKFHLSQTASGAVMAIDNVLALFMLPFFGALSDRVITRMGRRTPFILIGTIVAAVAFVFLPRVGSLSAFIVLLMVCLVAMATFRSPAVALMPDVTIKPLRSKGNAIINLMGAVGGILALGAGILFATGRVESIHTTYPLYFVFISGGMFLSLLIFMLTVKETRFVKDMHAESERFGIEEDADTNENAHTGIKLEKATRRSLLFLLASIVLWFMGYNAVTSKYSVYATSILQKDFNLTLMIAQIAAILSYIPVGIIASKVGRKKTILAGIVMLTIAFGGAGFMRADSPTPVMNVLFALAGIAWATINVNSFPMVVEMCAGADIGRYTGYYYTASMAAQTITPILSGALMDRLHMTVLFPYATCFCALAFVTMLFVKHGDSRPVAIRGLEALEDAG